MDFVDAYIVVGVIIGLPILLLAGLEGAAVLIGALARWLLR